MFLKKVTLVLASALLITSCMSKTGYPELTQERFKTLVASLPDHYVELDSTSFTPEYCNAWTEAWAIPDGGLGDIGNGEFLCYFVCGNDPCEKHSGKLESMKVTGDTAYVDFKIIHTASMAPHTLKLVVRNGRWVIADYDHTLSQMQEYLQEQIVYLQSDHFREYAQSILDNPQASEDWKNLVRNDLKEIEE